MSVDLREVQIGLEKDSVEAANSSYIRGVLDAMRQGRYDDLGSGKKIMEIMYTPVKDKIQEYFDAELRGATGKLRNLIKMMGSPEELAYVVVVTTLKQVMSHNNNIKLSSLSRHIGRAVKKLHYFDRLKKDNPKLHAYLGHEYRRASSKRKEELITKHITSVYAIENNEGADVQDVRIGTTLVHLLTKSGIDFLSLSLVHQKKSKSKIAYNIGFSSEAVDLLLTTGEASSFVLKPMVVQPNDWTSYNTGGYLTIKLDLVKTRHWLHSREQRKADYSKVFPAINKLQKVPWRVNKRVYDVVKHIFDNNMVDPTSPKELPRLYGDLPTRDRVDVYDIIDKMEWTDSPTKKQKEEYGVWNRNRERILIGLDGEAGRRLQLITTLDMAKDMLEYERFWYVYTMDYRGRVYPKTDFLSPQSKGSTKAMLEFANGKMLDERGVYWLRVHTANTYGLDKEPFKDRVMWSIKNSQMFLDIACDPMGNISKWAYSDSPYEFLASCFAWHDYHNGEPIRLPIQLDAVNSGIQFYSGLLLDKEGAEATCVIGDKRSDLYQLVADKVNNYLKNKEYPRTKEFIDGEGKVTTVSCDIEAKSLEGKVTRAMTKRNVMTVPYSVTHRGMKMQNWEVMDKMSREGKKFWKGDDWIVNYLWTELTYRAIFEIVSGARVGQEYLRSVSDTSNCVAKWHTPIYNFPVMQPSYKRAIKRIQTPLGTLEIGVGTDKYNRGKDLSSIAANYIHSLDSTLLLYCVENSTDNIGVIHDCFLVHPNNGDEIRKNYKEGYITIMEQSPLSMLSKEVDKEGKVSVPCIGTLNLDDVMNSEYIIS